MDSKYNLCRHCFFLFHLPALEMADTKAGPWELLRKTWNTCKGSIEDEMTCDALKGPDHPDCQRLFLRNEDCFQRVLCQERYVGVTYHHSHCYRWKEALDCINSKAPEACELLVKRSRACKDRIFQTMLSAPLREYLGVVGKLLLTCDLFL